MERLKLGQALYPESFEGMNRADFDDVVRVARQIGLSGENDFLRLMQDSAKNIPYRDGRNHHFEGPKNAIHCFFWDQNRFVRDEPLPATLWIPNQNTFILKPRPERLH